MSIYLYSGINLIPLTFIPNNKNLVFRKTVIFETPLSSTYKSRITLQVLGKQEPPSGFQKYLYSEQKMSNLKYFSDVFTHSQWYTYTHINFFNCFSLQLGSRVHSINYTAIRNYTFRYGRQFRATFRNTLMRYHIYWQAHSQPIHTKYQPTLTATTTCIQPNKQLV